MSVLETLKQANTDGKLLDSALENITRWLGGDFLPEWAVKSIEELTAKEAFEELNDRFYQNMAFGTGGLRGRTIGRVSAEAEIGTPSEQGTPSHPAVGSNVLNDFNVIRATMGLFRYADTYLKQQEIFDVPKLVIAHDVRHFSRYFCELAASTWTRMGGLAMIFEGPRSTPQLSFSVRSLKATCGVVITASHNPPHDNGFKAYFADGAQIVEPHASAIIDEVNNVALADTAKHLDIDLEKVITLPESLDTAYQNSVKDTVLNPEVFQKSSVKVVFTPIHGTGGVASIPLLKDLGVDVNTVTEQDAFDPRFPTVKSPNPENAEALSMAIEKAKSIDADVVMATDPDCDRMGVAVRDGNGDMQLLTGNMIGSVLAEYRISKMKEIGLLPPGGTQNAAMVKTFVTTPLQDAIGKGHGLKVINTLTGFKWIGEKIRIYEETLQEKLLEEESFRIDYDNTPYTKRADLLKKHSTFYVFGGEESYGYLGSDAVRDKDANSAVVMFCELAAELKNQGKTFLDYLDAIYLKYGFYLEQLGTLVYEGAAGAQKIKNILKSYRDDAPKSINGIAIKEVKDFGTTEIFDDDGKKIPAQDFFFLTFENGYQFAVRGSGTEPKIKFYVFGREDVADQAALAATKEKTRETLTSLKEAILKDADERSNG